MGIPALLNDPEAFEAEMVAFESPKEGEDGLAALSHADGFITAVIVCPRFIPPGEWMPHLIDPSSADLSVEEIELSEKLLLAGYREILDSLAARDAVYEPYFWEDRDGRLITKNWAEGFLAGMELREDDWAPRFDGDGCVDLVTLFILLQDEEFLAKIAEEGVGREESFEAAQAELPVLVHALFECSPHGSPRDYGTYKHAGKKIGRNDPCPCGSGKKYKKCCLN